MKLLSLLIITSFCTIGVKAQPWIVPGTGNIYYNGGNVGIGTTNPLTKLQVDGTPSNGLLSVLSVNNNLNGLSAQNNGAAITIGQSGSYYTKIATVYEQNNPSYLQPALAFYTMYNSYLAGSEVERMRISSNGNVGIGTTNPTYKLDVIGTIRAKEIKVDLNGADFVFETDYKLMPINELEAFVKEQKHLPNVAPVKEMQENGTDLGDLNSKLLQKIEELTLYAIEQNKSLIVQAKKIESLEKTVSNLISK